MPISFTIPLEIYKGSSFFTSSLAFGIITVLYFSFSSGCIASSHQGLVCRHLMANGIEYVFMGLIRQRMLDMEQITTEFIALDW